MKIVISITPITHVSELQNYKVTLWSYVVQGAIQNNRFKAVIDVYICKNHTHENKYSHRRSTYA